VFEFDKSDWFKKIEEPKKLTPLFQNMEEPTTKESYNKIFSLKFSLELKCS